MSMPTKKTRAFTLIELIIVIAIILMMAVAAIPAYQNYGRKQEVSMKAEEIKALIDRAEAYSKNPAQGKNCAHVQKAGSDISIQFGSINPDAFADTNGCVISGDDANNLSSKDTVSTLGFTVQFGASSTKPIDRFFAFYPGTPKLYYRDGGVDRYPQINKIIVSNPGKTTWVATITIDTLPYSANISIQK